MKKTVLAMAMGLCALSAHAADPQPISMNVQIAGEVPSTDVFEATPVGWTSGDTFEMPVPGEKAWRQGSTTIAHEIYWNLKSSYGPIHITVKGADVLDYLGTRAMKNAKGENYPFQVYASAPSGDSWSGWKQLGPVDARVILSAAGAAKGSKAGLRLTVGGTPAKRYPYPPPGEYNASFSVVMETGIN